MSSSSVQTVPTQQEADAGTETNQQFYQGFADVVSSLPCFGGLSTLKLYLHSQGWHSSQPSMVGAMVAGACFAARPTDVVLCSLPKSGTTWTKALLYATARRGEHPPDAADHPFHSLGPHQCVETLEYQVYAHGRVPDLAGLPDPRLFSTHVPFAALPASVAAAPGCKIVYVCRDPKDTLVSLIHFINKLSAKHGVEPLSAEATAEMFCAGVSPFGPYWEHLLGYWRAHLARPEQVLFLRYEKMQRDPAAHVRRLAEFVGVPFGDGEDGAADAIASLCAFERMTRLEATKSGKTELVIGAVENSSFFRRGVVGDWANHLSPETARRIDDITRSKFEGTGLSI